MSAMLSFWAEWLPPAYRQRFCEALSKDEHARLECDNDPDAALLEALRAAGLECRGTGNSVLDVGFPFGTCTFMENGVAMVRWGTFSPSEPITDALLRQVAKIRDVRGRVL